MYNVEIFEMHRSGRANLERTEEGVDGATEKTNTHKAKICLQA